MAVFQALSPGDHVVLPESVYYGTRKLMDQVFGAGA
jgi:cystathionine beta-lyase/cystathionine gamma-synthase